jgi:hypothetical protein
MDTASSPADVPGVATMPTPVDGPTQVLIRRLLESESESDNEKGRRLLESNSNSSNVTFVVAPRYYEFEDKRRVNEFDQVSVSMFVDFRRLNRAPQLRALDHFYETSELHQFTPPISAQLEVFDPDMHTGNFSLEIRSPVLTNFSFGGRNYSKEDYGCNVSMTGAEINQNFQSQHEVNGLSNHNMDAFNVKFPNPTWYGVAPIYLKVHDQGNLGYDVFPQKPVKHEDFDHFSLSGCIEVKQRQDNSRLLGAPLSSFDKDEYDITEPRASQSSRFEKDFEVLRENELGDTKDLSQPTPRSQDKAVN